MRLCKNVIYFVPIAILNLNVTKYIFALFEIVVNYILVSYKNNHNSYFIA